TIRNELSQYSAELVTRPEVVALTKSEGLDDEMIEMQIEAVRAVAGEKAEVFAVSSTAHKGITEVLRSLRIKVQAARNVEKEIDEVDNDTVVISLSEQQVSDSWIVTKDEETGHFVVSGEKVEKFARRTNFDNYEGVNRLRDIMKKLGVSHELARAGAVGDSIVEIAGHEFTLLEQ
ncbi:MAG TPA: Obg family GTPase CgtA, partial [Candidatus Saccharimonadales bacterium]|nr:Obg family GTPase CgtA [Candidatus Saccharimonadales bacterium]